MNIRRFPLGFLWTNCYVVWDDTKEAIVVDPGGDTTELREFLKAEGLSLRWIMLTHGHGDHLMGVGELREFASEGVAIHAEDADCLSNASQNLSGSMGQPAIFDRAERLLKDGEVISVGSMKVTVIHTPGHTRGGCCFYVEKGSEALLLSGDTLFARSVGRTDLPGGDERVLLQSLQKLENMADNIRVYPGHGPDTTIGEERALNPFWPR